NEWIDRETAGRCRGPQLLNQCRHLGRYTPGQPRGDPAAARLLHAEQGQRECEERDDHRVSTLLRRPKPSSTAGAPGSGTQRTPSTTNAYWCCPAGKVSVAVHTPVDPERTSGVACASH